MRDFCAACPGVAIVLISHTEQISLITANDRTNYRAPACKRDRCRVEGRAVVVDDSDLLRFDTPSSKYVLKKHVPERRRSG